MKLGKYVIQPIAPIKNLKLLLLGQPHRVPFIVNTDGFISIPQPTRYFIVEQDGIEGQWFAHDNNFINVAESFDVCFADTPQAALMDYMHEYGEKS